MYNDISKESIKTAGAGAKSAKANKATNAYAGASETELLDRYFGDWIWRAVECLVGLKEFNPSPRWIAERLGVTIEQAVDALDGLLELGQIIRDQDGGFVRNTVAADLARDLRGPSDSSKRQKMQDHLLLSTQINSKLCSAKNNFYSDGFVAANLDFMNRHVSNIRSALMNMYKEARELPQEHVDSVYGISLGVSSLDDKGRE